jgi:uncharacterized membrane protein YgcG
MKLQPLKPFLLSVALLWGAQAARAQFDDVYYDPDTDVLPGYAENTSAGSAAAGDNGVLYYDNESYPYYDDQATASGYGDGWNDYQDYNDYDYYYSSRIRRFHRPFIDVDFFSPFYTGFHVYDPFAWDAYYYPGASIYFNFGFGYNDYYAWRRYNYWNRWNNGFHWNNWCYAPPAYYYSYNAWCPPGPSYWGWGPQYHTYSNYYYNYYNGCPIPVSHYNGITHTTINVISQGSDRGTYYGPRVTGNTGSSPRGPVIPPGQVSPIDKDGQGNVTDSNDTPRGLPGGTAPGIANPQTDQGPVRGTPAVPKETGSGDITDGVRQVPADRELPKEPGGKRPVFDPDAQNYQPRPYTPREPARNTPDNSPSGKVYTPDRTPDKAPTVDQPTRQYTPQPRNQPPAAAPPAGRPRTPAYTPADQDRPRQSPSSGPVYRPTERPRSQSEQPAYRPAPRQDTRSQSTDDRPSYRPAPREDDRSSAPQRSYEPPRRESSPSHSPSRSYDRPSGGSSSGQSGSSRSSGGSSGGGSSSGRSGSSPRGGG